MNAHVATAFSDLAALAARLGRADEHDKFAAAAHTVAGAIFARLGGAGAQCDPPAAACVLDNLDRASSTVQSTLFPLSMDADLAPHAPSREAFLPFLRARYYHGDGVTARASPWATGFMLKGLAALALTGSNITGIAEAAEFAHAVLTSHGPHSWLGMVERHNATMTMEAWDAASGSGTMSHPWNAAPAYLIPRHLIGLRPLAPAFARVLVAPVVSPALASASLRLPTLRGTFEVNVSLAPAARATISLALPGNTLADVCLPAYAVAPRVAVSVDGTATPAATRGGMACVNGVRPGRHVLEAVPAGDM